MVQASTAALHLSGKQASAQDILSQGVHLWCSNRVSDKSDWSDVSDLPAGKSGGHYRLTGKYRRPEQ